MSKYILNRIREKLPRLTDEELLDLDASIQTIRQARGLTGQNPAGIDPDDFEAFRAGMDGMAQTLRRQRDDYKRIVQDAHEAFRETVLMAEYIEKDSYQTLMAQRDKFQQESQEYPIPLIIEWIDKIATEIEHQRVGFHNQAANAIEKRGNLTYKLALQHALEEAAISGGREVQINLMQKWRELTNNPFTVCFELLLECRYLDSPNIQTVGRLDLEWIKANIDKRIGSHKWLWEAIYQSWQFYKSKEKRERYANNVNLSVDTLDKYVASFDKIRELAEKVPDIKEQWREVFEW